MPGRKVTRGGVRGGRRGKPKTKIGQALYQYWQPGLHNQDLNALANGADTGIVLIDHSADFADSIVRWRKLTLRWHFYGADLGNFASDELLMMVTKPDQDDTQYPALDSEEVVNELRRDQKSVRGPWIITTPSRSTGAFTPPMAAMMKPIVLENFDLLPEQDLVVSWTNISNASLPVAQQTVRFYPMGYYRKMPV